ncbi:hypothetical protein [Lacunisphaera limnophila]|uniref:hypothetical protein n=1 Tax=Lacunisphaera limnophila TaxID=1838286 RepID=UPI000859AC63|nr:hypothetical protein [Lacunisphaera limnophila]
MPDSVEETPELLASRIGKVLRAQKTQPTSKDMENRVRELRRFSKKLRSLEDIEAYALYVGGWICAHASDGAHLKHFFVLTDSKG